MAAQRWDADEYARIGAFVPELGMSPLALLAPAAGERILDLGCGDGVLTVRIASAGSTVVGVDTSETMIEAARSRGLDTRIMDGAHLDFTAEFDAVFSNAALHWMGDLGVVCRGVLCALRPGGRFVGELGAAGNVASVVGALGDGLRARGIDPETLNPWVFPTDGEFNEVLRTAGFQIRSIEIIPRPTPLRADLIEWLRTFAACFLDPLSDRDRHNLEQEVRRMLAPRLRRPDGVWLLDYVRLRFAAVKPTQRSFPRC